MYRNIIFRGKNIEFGNWDFGSLVFDDMNNGYILKSSHVEKDGHHLVHNSDEPIDYDQKTFGQDTLEIDWKGTHCFELDIVKIIPQGNWESGSTPWIGVIVFDDVTPKILMDNGKFELVPLKPSLYMRFEVIGNIFDNEDLINDQMLSEVHNNWL